MILKSNFFDIVSVFLVLLYFFIYCFSLVDNIVISLKRSFCDIQLISLDAFKNTQAELCSQGIGGLALYSTRSRIETKGNISKYKEDRDNE